MINALIKNLRFRVGSTIANSTLLFPLYNLDKNRAKLIVQADTQLCIEGVQRTANGFFEMVFRKYNKEVKVSHHQHSTANFLKAKNKKIPRVVLIRHPEQAVASLIIKNTDLWTGNALRNYINFYQNLMEYKKDIVIGEFDSVIAKPHEIIEAINHKYNVDFNAVDLDEQQRNQIMQQIAQRAAKQNRSANWTATPNKHKEDQKKLYLEEIRGHHLYPEALKTYQDFIAN